MMIPDNKIHGAIMGPTCVLSAPDEPHIGPMNLAIRDDSKASHIPEEVLKSAVS